MSIMDEAESQPKQCRICLDDEHPDGIISPCLCSGNSAYVHRECLNNWRSMNKNGRGFKACDICSFEYVIETINTNPDEERKRLRKYYFFVTRDLSLMMSAIQLVILVLAYLIKRIDKNSEQIPEYFPRYCQGFLAYYLTSIVILLSIIGVLTLLILCITDRGRNIGNFNTFGTGASNSKGGFAGLVIILLIIGILVVVFSSVMLIRKILQHHTNKLWLRQEAEKYIVKDFQGRREELSRHRNVNNAQS